MIGLNYFLLYIGYSEYLYTHIFALVVSVFPKDSFLEVKLLAQKVCTF